jgi:hypothetical protein
MIIIKLFLLVILSIAFFLFAFSSRLRAVQKLSVISGYLILFLFIAYPKYSDAVAHLFSIQSGTDMVIYIVVPLTALVNIVLYIGFKNDNASITKIIREQAKHDAKRCE